MDTLDQNQNQWPGENSGHSPETLSPQPELLEEMELAEQPAPEPKPKSEKKKSGLLKGLVAAVLAVALVAGSSGATAWLLSRRFDEQLRQASSDYQSRLEALEQRFDTEKEQADTVISTTPGQTQEGEVVTVASGATPASVYQNNCDSVVLIKSQIASSYYSSGGTSTGSGFIISADGYVVTNYHVVEGGTELSVVTADNTEYPATLVGYDSANDVAVLKVEAEGLKAVTLGSSAGLQVGDQVVAIGNPLGELTSTLTVGYVSAMERDVNTSGFAINMIQTDAAINSGNSGGPLFDMNGKVVGITTAKYSGSSSSGATIEGIGFAIPIDDVLALIEDLVTYGYSKSPYLGVSVSDMDAEGAAYYGMPMGAYVNEVVDGFCAAKAGMQAKDIIVDVGGNAVESVNDLSRALRQFAPGDTVTVTVCRSGAYVELTVTLDEKPVETESEELTELPQETEPSGSGWESILPGWG